MHNGRTGEYMNTVLSSHAPLNSNSNIPYYLSNNHQNSSNFLTSDPYELAVSGYNNSDKKSSQNSSDPFTINDEYSHKKPLKFSQRPATAKSTEGRLHLETSTPMIHPSFRRGHRKKTLSLNPEEREALESLVEDVIIVGLKDAVLDSDESSDESNNDNEDTASPVSDSNTISDAAVRKKLSDNDTAAKVAENNDEEAVSDGSSLKNYEQMKDNYTSHTSPSSSHFSTPNQDIIKRHNVINNNFINNKFINNNNNTLLNHNNGYMFKPALNRSNYHNNTAMKQRDFYLNSFNRQNKDASKKHFATSDMLPPMSNNPNPPNNKNHNELLMSENNNHNSNNNNSRQSISNMLSINIYPAQLKVAIKHMDSLPPRFLKRLQTGHNRIGGSEPTLQSLSELNLNHSRLDSSLNSVFPACNQATFSAKTSPVTPSLNLAPLSATESNSACSSVEKDRSRSKQTQLAETKKIIRNLLGDLDQYTDEAINHTGEGGEEEGKGDFHNSYQQFHQATIPSSSLITPSFVPADSLFRMNSNRFNSESQLNSLDLQPPHHIRASSSFFNEQTTSRQFNSLDVAQAPSSYFHKPPHFYDHSHTTPLPKKTSLKADAPVFVSSQFPTKSDASKTRSSDPEITLLPGVLNANFIQQQRIASSKQAVPETAISPAFPYKMHPSHFYTPMPSSQAPTNDPHYRGYMPMLNYNQPPPPYPSYPLEYNTYTPPMQPHHSPLYYNHDYNLNQHSYQPWLPSVAPAELFHGNDASQWYSQPQYMEQPITGLGDGGVWPIHEGELSLEEGRQKVGQLMRKGVSVMVVYEGIGAAKLSELQLGLSGMFVLNLSQPHQHLNPNHPHHHHDSHVALEKLNEWNHKKVTETLDGGRSLVVIDQLSCHHDELNEWVYMAKCRSYEVVFIRGKVEEGMFGNNSNSMMCCEGGGDGLATAATAELLEFPAN